MSWPQILGDVAYRAAWLLGLAIAPPFMYPEPRPPARLALAAVVSVLLIAAAAYGARRLRSSHARGSFAASALILAALIAAVACAAIFRGPRAPLGRGLLFVAIPLWAGLAVAAGAVAGGRPGAWRRLTASLLVAAVGATLLGGSARWILSSEKMWARSLHGVGEHQPAIDAITRDALGAHDYRGAIAALDRCLEDNPRACACRAERAEVRTRVPDADRATLDAAIADARAALEACPQSRGARATIATALLLRGDDAEAEKETRDALKDDARSPRLHYALALALHREGRSLEALAEAQQAAELGEGRDAAELFGAIVIALGDLGGAERALDPLTGDKTDAPVLYGRAIVAERLKDDKKARELYFATLLADPTFANARYNLVVLGLRDGNLREAKSHAKKFASAFPQDPRNMDLERRIAAASPTP